MLLLLDYGADPNSRGTLLLTLLNLSFGEGPAMVKSS